MPVNFLRALLIIIDVCVGKGLKLIQLHTWF